MSDAPIGVFDSGIGGLSVYAEIRRLLPNQDVVYVADQGFGMYGEQTLSAVRRRSERIAGWLIERGAGTVVVACNSASAASLQQLRVTFPSVSFVGMEPAVKPAATLSSNGTIAVLATEATFQGELFASVVDRFASGHEVIEKACPGLAAAIEYDDPATNGLIAEFVGDVIDRGADVVVLGCTHYSLARDRFVAMAGAAQVIDPVPAVARQVARVFGADAPMPGGAAGRVSFFTTGDRGGFSGQLDRRGLARGFVGSVEV